jgi:hypothetical protein
MSDTKTPTATPAETPKPKKSARITLTSGDALLLLNAKARKDGSAETYVTTTSGKDAKPVRGMTSKHKAFADALTTLEALAKKAEAGGWKRRVAAFGFRAKPDAFSALPAPPKGKAK